MAKVKSYPKCYDERCQTAEPYKLGDDKNDDEGDGDDDDDHVEDDDDDGCLEIFQRTLPLSLVLWCVTCARTPLWCTTQTSLPTNRRSTSARVPKESALPGAMRKSSHYWPRDDNHGSNFCARSAILSAWRQGQHLRAHSRRAPVRSCIECRASGRTSLNIGLRVVPNDPGLKLVFGHRPLILVGRVGAPHISPNTHHKGCNSGTVFVQGLQRLHSGHSRRAPWRPTRRHADKRRPS